MFYTRTLRLHTSNVLYSYTETTYFQCFTRNKYSIVIQTLHTSNVLHSYTKTTYFQCFTRNKYSIVIQTLVHWNYILPMFYQEQILISIIYIYHLQNRIDLYVLMVNKSVRIPVNNTYAGQVRINISIFAVNVERY
jgi:hypothetical protein